MTFGLAITLQVAGIVAAPATGTMPWTDVDLTRVPWRTIGAVPTQEQHLGRAALRLEGGMLILPEANLRNGELFVDIALPPQRAYVGVGWRVVDSENLERFYLRPHQSGQPDSCQYAPVDHGSTAWQLYPESSAAMALETEVWTRVHLTFWDDELRVRVDSDSPQLVTRLRRAPMVGDLALQVGGGAAAHFSRLRYRPLTTRPEGPPPPTDTPPPGVVEHWQVSSLFHASTLDGIDRLSRDSLDKLSWSRLEAAPSGVANLAQLYAPGPGGDTCFARLKLVADQGDVVHLDFGFSDRVRIYRDGLAVYGGDNSYRSRDHRFLGTLGLHDRLTLHLAAGETELLFAVSETFGGWGLIAALDAPAHAR